jgi:ABC-type branched-subunit amino acid transport system ATPase component
MVLGQVLTTGAPQEVLSHPEVIDAYVGGHE